jgi:hypothetical protein
LVRAEMGREAGDAARAVRRAERAARTAYAARDAAVLALIAAIAALSGTDAILTLQLVTSSGLQAEGNPLMRAVLAWGPGTFVGVKMIVTGFGLGLLGVGAGRGFPRIRALLAGIFVGYVALLGYHLYVAHARQAASKS